ncbi:PQQ-binding-like beta-propeller repeat protein [Ktedonobacter racemifer]
MSPNEDVIHASVAVDEDLVYTGSSDHSLYALQRILHPTHIYLPG